MVMNALASLFADRPVVLCDGGMGTMLQAAGIEAGETGELWNVERPEAIAKIHRSYLAAGATLLTTNTFGGSRPRLEMNGLGDRTEELNRAGAAVARGVADEFGALVGGNLGPTGELMEPLGTMTHEQAKEYFAEQLRGLVAGGIDLVLIETMSDLAEADAAVAAAHEVAPDLPVIATMSFDTNLRTMMGVTPTAAMSHLASAGVQGIGANCGRGPVEMEQIAAELVAARTGDVMVVTQSNAGLPRPVGDHFEYDGTPELMAEHVKRLRGLGVDVVGACCGSTPEHVRAMRAALGG